MTPEPHDHNADGDVVASSTPAQTEKRRTRSGCAICRRRKIKCDERAGGCIACERLQLNCPGYGVNALPVSESLNTSSDVTKAGIRRRRVWQSCAACRRSKTRCSSGRPPCARCEKRGLTCFYPDSHRPIPNLPPTENALTTGSEPATPIRMNTNPEPLESPSWLYSDHLPGHDHIRELVEDYFAVFHPLRCFNFLHKPTFIQRLDNGSAQDRGNALLHVVCSLGAKSYALRHALKSGIMFPKWILTAGNKWADFALRKVLDELNVISVENLMAAVILQDHQIRLGKYSTAFMLTGFTTRMAQALQINLEFSSDVLCHDSTKSPNATSKESRRRLMWACYITDASVGSGVDQLTLLNEEDIKIQLPCEERHFLLQTPCVTELLKRGEVLSFIPEHCLPATPSASMGLTAYYIRLVAIRKRILRYVKQLGSAQPPWLPGSEFNTLRNACAEWHCSLPQNLQYSAATLYIRAETGELGALCLLHGTYYETLIDLYRIFAPALYKLRSTFEFPSDQRDYLIHRQRELYDHARSIANIAIEAMNRQGPTALADFWWPSITYDSCRHMVYYVTQVQPGNSELMSDTTTLLESNIEALRMMRQLCAMAEPLYMAAGKMLSKLNIAGNSHNIGPEDPTESDETCSATAPGTPTQTTPDYVLHPLSIYRMARKSIPEKHAPEKTTPTSTAAHNLSPSTNSLHDGQSTSPGSGMAVGWTTTAPVLSQPPTGENIASHGSWMDEELQLQCPSEMTSFWEPAATVESGLYNTELPPWLTDFQQDQFWLDFWPGPRE